MTSTDCQPVSQVQWVQRDQLSANDWNPNRQAPSEHELLRISLLENGWTQPIVVRNESGRWEIVDGYHRWLAAANSDVAKLTGGMVPIVELTECAPEVARMATIRHNRARGVHYVAAMADIVCDLRDLGLTETEIGSRLKMDSEEVSRLIDHGVMTTRGAATDFNTGWTV